MNCFAINQKLGCYVDGALPDKERHEIERHLRDCPNCLRDFEAIKGIEHLLRVETYPEPPKEYWTALPRTITDRLGLSIQRTTFDGIRSVLDQLLRPKYFRWALAAAAVLFISIISLKDRFVPDPVGAPLSEQDVANAQADSGKEADGLAMFGKSQVYVKAGRYEEAITKSTAAGRDHPLPKTQQARNDNAIQASKTESLSHQTIAPLALNGVEKLPVRFRQPGAPRYEEKIYPVPNTRFILAMEMMQSNRKEDDISNVLTFSFDHGGNRSQLQPPGRPDDSEVAENEFYEVLLIVQEINSLDEERNIWLSYLSRESDPTFRALGVFNLAMVLSKIALQSQDPDKAQEALDFFEDNDEALRFQLRNRYEARIAQFRKIMAGASTQKSRPANQ